MATIAPISDTLEVPRRSLNAAMICFIGLQLLDLLSTYLVFSQGGIEMNPVVRVIMPITGRLMALLVSKAALVTIIWTFARKRKRILVLADILYTGVVIWNFVVLYAFFKAPHGG